MKHMNLSMRGRFLTAVAQFLMALSLTLLAGQAARAATPVDQGTWDNCNIESSMKLCKDRLLRLRDEIGLQFVMIRVQSFNTLKVQEYANYAQIIGMKVMWALDFYEKYSPTGTQLADKYGTLAKDAGCLYPNPRPNECMMWSIFYRLSNLPATKGFYVADDTGYTNLTEEVAKDNLNTWASTVSWWDGYFAPNAGHDLSIGYWGTHEILSPNSTYARFNNVVAPGNMKVSFTNEWYPLANSFWAAMSREDFFSWSNYLSQVSGHSKSYFLQAFRWADNWGDAQSAYCAGHPHYVNNDSLSWYPVPLAENECAYATNNPDNSSTVLRSPFTDISAMIADRNNAACRGAAKYIIWWVLTDIIGDDSGSGMWADPWFPGAQGASTKMARFQQVVGYPDWNWSC